MTPYVCCDDIYESPYIMALFWFIIYYIIYIYIIYMSVCVCVCVIATALLHFVHFFAKAKASLQTKATLCVAGCHTVRRRYTDLFYSILIKYYSIQFVNELNIT